MSEFTVDDAALIIAARAVAAKYVGGFVKQANPQMVNILRNALVAGAGGAALGGLWSLLSSDRSPRKTLRSALTGGLIGSLGGGLGTLALEAHNLTPQVERPVGPDLGDKARELLSQLNPIRGDKPVDTGRHIQPTPMNAAVDTQAIAEANRQVEAAAEHARPLAYGAAGGATAYFGNKAVRGLAHRVAPSWFTANLPARLTHNLVTHGRFVKPNQLHAYVATHAAERPGTRWWYPIRQYGTQQPGGPWTAYDRATASQIRAEAGLNAKPTVRGGTRAAGLGAVLLWILDQALRSR